MILVNQMSVLLKRFDIQQENSRILCNLTL
nr:MAG TPA: hypothetical protein [Caudoviricetes sp.]